MAERGRPTKYSPEFCEEAHRLCLLGFRNADLARFFDVAESTVGLWCLEHPEFSKALAEGRELADSRISQSLYNRALNGDVRAQEFWLKNRAREWWKEKVELEHTGDADALTARLLAGRMRSGKPEEPSTE